MKSLLAILGVSLGLVLAVPAHPNLASTSRPATRTTALSSLT